MNSLMRTVGLYRRRLRPDGGVGTPSVRSGGVFPVSTNQYGVKKYSSLAWFTSFCTQLVQMCVQLVQMSGSGVLVEEL